MTQTSSQYTQRYIIQDMYGTAFTANGQTEDLISSPATPYPLNKAMWIFFPQQTNRPGEWVELGGGKGLTATSIAIPNPQLQDQTYRDGHYFTYQRVTADGSRWYYEGSIGSANPTGSHRYKLERDLTQPNRWKSSVDNVAAYLITIAGASNYNVGKQLNIGIESQDNQHSFTNGTSVENIWTYPVGASGFQNYTGTAPVAAENNNRGWYSLWFPSQTYVYLININKRFLIDIFHNYTGTAPLAAENNSYGWYSGWFPSQTGSPNIIQLLRP